MWFSIYQIRFYVSDHIILSDLTRWLHHVASKLSKGLLVRRMLKKIGLEVKPAEIEKDQQNKVTLVDGEQTSSIKNDGNQWFGL